MAVSGTPRTLAGLLSRIAPRRGEARPASTVAAASAVHAQSAQNAQGVHSAPSGPSTQAGVEHEPVFPTKALRKFISCLGSHESPVLLDLGPVVGSNVSFFGEQLGCKILVENIFADLNRHVRDGKLDAFPAFLGQRFSQASGSVDGILCWDLLDYLDRRAAQALATALMRLLRPDGVLLGFFGTAQPRDARYTKYIIVDEVNLQHRPYPAAGGRQAILLNRDIIRLFDELQVSDSFLLQTDLREILFRKPSAS